eukprot:CAMPEP_0174268694 /NCGR_PEP_ID=MMETSP0439-20130205/38315_1 /TAXON_ID=0 /ORGANISM="Stereomyxa ramosa, Strain Chinc5" /LENGTH=309 /DNA_ID=CAMNT_0015357023 /DNA_START=143 /DNA_END=1072 /DNA_ORIENTATION=+
MKKNEEESVRVMTWNVHAWKTDEFMPNTSSVASVVDSLHPDIFCFQEANNQSRWLSPEFDSSVESMDATEFDYFSSKLVNVSNMEFINLYGCVTGLVMGVSKDKFDILSVHKKVIETDDAEERPLLGVTLLAKKTAFKFSVFCVHLDHQHESTRMIQVGKILKSINKNGEDKHILMGDFNSLKRSDYNDKQWQRLISYNTEREWEPPSSDIISFLSGVGYSDSWEEGVEKSKPKAESEEISDEHCLDNWLSEDFPSTSFTGRRIDYIFLSQDFSESTLVERCDIVDSDASDHFPLCVDVVLNKRLETLT